MTRGKGSAPNRFAQAVAAQRVAGSLQPPATIGELRNLQRAEVLPFNQNGVWLPNPSAEAPFDRHGPQTYDQKVRALGLAPNVPQHFWQLLKGDAGAASSVYRDAELFQLLAPLNQRTAATPYSKAIQIATWRTSDQRPRFIHTSMFSVGRVLSADPGPIAPLPTNEITQFADGIPAGTPSVSGTTQFGVPQFSTSQFRVMVHDESGQRFVDADVFGTRSMNFWAFGVTVFALIKEDGYEIDRQRDDNAALGPGLVDQSLVGARIVPIRSNDTKNINNRTVTIRTPGFAANPDPSAVPIPPGTSRVKIYAIDGVAAVGTHTLSFATVDPLDTANPTIGTQGTINFDTAAPSQTVIYDVPNSNAILITPSIAAVASLWSFAFEVTS